MALYSHFKNEGQAMAKMSDSDSLSVRISNAYPVRLKSFLFVTSDKVYCCRLVSILCQDTQVNTVRSSVYIVFQNMQYLPFSLYCMSRYASLFIYNVIDEQNIIGWNKIEVKICVALKPECCAYYNWMNSILFYV